MRILRAMWRVAVLLPLGVLAIARPASAGEPARLVYARSADASSCPDEAALRSAVAARFGYDPFFAWAKRTVVVEVSRRGERYASRVQMLDERGMARGVRDLTTDGPSCSELFDATALAISIALDASSKPEVPAAVAVESPSTTPRALTPPEPLPSLRDVPRDEPEPPPVAGAPVPSWFVGVDVLGSQGTAPSVSAGMAAFGGVRVNALSAALELRADVPASTTTVDARQATSWLYALELVPCVHFGALSVCALGTVGQFVVSSTGVSSPSSSTSLFVATGARLGAEWSLSRALLLRAHVDGLVDLDPPTYRLDGTDRWIAPPLAVSLAVGVALRIP
jgi:hypothetical protein